MAINRDALYAESTAKLLHRTYYRLNQSEYLAQDWKDEAMQMLDDMREELIDWLVSSEKAMTRERKREAYKRRVQRKEAQKDVQKGV